MLQRYFNRHHISFIMLPISFAPIQGYTDYAYRRIHWQKVGGVDHYYTPFLRWERGGLRNKDIRDLDHISETPTIPQIIARDRDELSYLCDAIQERGIRRIDINMGCPFPLQTGAGRGSGLLPHPERVEGIIDEMNRRKDVTFSIKMRLGLKEEDECLRLLPLLNDAPLSHITMHPRLGIQQYKGKPSMAAFGRFLEACKLPVIYNGDICTIEQIIALEQEYPTLCGIMVGRGLLARPTLAKEYTCGTLLSEKERLNISLQMHDDLMAHAEQYLEGDSQQLARLHCFWEYQEELLPKKCYKLLMKSKSMRSYREAISLMKSAL